YNAAYAQYRRSCYRQCHDWMGTDRSQLKYDSETFLTDTPESNRHCARLVQQFWQCLAHHAAQYNRDENHQLKSTQPSALPPPAPANKTTPATPQLHISSIFLDLLIMPQSLPQLYDNGV